jgi:hypothetical protein
MLAERNALEKKIAEDEAAYNKAVTSSSSKKQDL